MGEMRFYAVGVDEVREIFSASPEAGHWFREVAAREFPPEPVKSPGLLGKLGPLLRRPPDAPLLRPDVPAEADVADLLSGRYVRPERQVASWRLLETWLAALAWSRHAFSLDQERFNDLEFDLARAGLHPRYGLGSLVNHQLAIPLQEYRGLSTGYHSYNHALATRDGWRAALPRLSEPNAAIAEPYLRWLEGFPEWRAEAGRRARATPDLIVVYRAG